MVLPRISVRSFMVSVLSETVKLSTFSCLKSCTTSEYSSGSAAVLLRHRYTAHTSITAARNTKVTAFAALEFFNRTSLLFGPPARFIPNIPPA